jgi:hypothetical protein
VMPILAVLQSLVPGDCLLTGLCAASQATPVVPSGAMFLAIGLVLIGAWGLVRKQGRAGK